MKEQLLEFTRKLTSTRVYVLTINIDRQLSNGEIRDSSPYVFFYLLNRRPGFEFTSSSILTTIYNLYRTLYCAYVSRLRGK